MPPGRNPPEGRPAKNNRMMLNGILYWQNTDMPWTDSPQRFGPWSGNCNDICLAQELLEGFDLQGEIILADKGYKSGYETIRRNNEFEEYRND